MEHEITKSEQIVQKNDELFAELKKYPEDSREYRTIVSKIIQNNQSLVNYIMDKYYSPASKRAFKDDLFVEGLLGMQKAIKLFDPAKGTFSTYAGKMIRNSMTNYLRQEKRHRMPSLQDNRKGYQDGDQQKLEDVLASPVNLEEDFTERDEADRRIAWVKAHLGQLGPSQRKVLINKYLSGEASLVGQALAEKMGFTKQNVSLSEIKAIKSLQKMYYESYPEEQKKKIELTSEEKIAAKAMLKDLIETKLSPQQKKAMLYRFYSPTKMTNQQTAQAINTTKYAVECAVHVGSKKLCTLCPEVRNPKHLRRILEFGLEKNK